MTQAEISRKAKSLATKAKVQTKVKSYGSSVYVTFLSQPTQAVIDAIEALSTHEAHGDLMNDTRWYSGIAIRFNYKFQPTAEQVEQFNKIKNQYSNCGDYHFQKGLREEMGFVGVNVLDWLGRGGK